MALDLTTLHVDGVAVVRARGSLDFEAVSLLREYLQRRVDAGDRVMVLDLLAVSDPEPSWGPAVAAASQEVTGRDGRIVVVASDPLRAAITGAVPDAAVAESLDAALGDAAPPLRSEPPHVEPHDPNQPPIAFGA